MQNALMHNCNEMLVYKMVNVSKLIAAITHTKMLHISKLHIIQKYGKSLSRDIQGGKGKKTTRTQYTHSRIIGTIRNLKNYTITLTYNSRLTEAPQNLDIDF